MSPPEDPRALAERHVREGEARVARQLVLIEELERDNHPEAAAVARAVLATLQTTLGLMRDHLRTEQGAPDPETPTSEGPGQQPA